MRKISIVLIGFLAVSFLVTGFTEKKFRNKSVNNLRLNIKEDRTYTIVVDKSDYELKLYDNQGWYATYPVVFGNPALGDKMMEGDRNTPEGTFYIVAKKYHNEWDRFLLLNYPNEESREKFEERKKEGYIPANARIGGGIGIHGTRRNEDRFVDYYYNWTLGCISMKRKDVEELYNMLPIGTKVIIQK